MRRRLISHVSGNLLTLVATCIISGLGCAPTEPGDAAADLLVTNGNVYTLSWDEPDRDGSLSPAAPGAGGAWHGDAEAVAVRDGEIVFVGSNADAAAYRGDSTRVIDVDGATVLPGLTDSHTHVVNLGAFLERVSLVDVETEEEAVALVAQRAQEVAEGQWIIGQGWDEGAWANRYPTMELLTEQVPNHPVFMRSLHSFAAWGNRMAFERAGITGETEAPSGGEIRKGSDGLPNGLLLNRATALLEDAIPAPTREQLKTRILTALSRMAEDGFVAVHEAGVDGEMMAAFEELDTAGRLPIRVYVMLSARDVELSRAWLAKGPDPEAAGMLVTRSVKAFYDGALGSRGARLLEDYSDQPGHTGVSGGEYGFDEELVADMMKAGFQVGIHAIGDAGNRETLDFIERVTGEDSNVRNGRHRIEHAQVVHPDDIPRFGALGVIASMEPAHAVEDKTWAEERVGPARIKGAYAWRSLREAGARLAFNSDNPGSDHNIFYGLHAAITRRDKQREPADGWYPEQAMTADEAVRGYTTWAAYAGFVEERTGVLAPGRWADITVMSVDPFALANSDPGAILDGSIVLTVADGKVIYER